LDERRGRLVIGLEPGKSSVRLRHAVLAAGVPEGVFEIIEMERIVPAGNLLGAVRPIIGGFMIFFGPGEGDACTLGFMARINEGGQDWPVALVNSHCTQVLADTDGGPIYQWIWGNSSHLIGLESRDPTPQACIESPNGCRYSDAALVLVSGTAGWGFPHIARTTYSEPLSGSIVIASDHPTFKIVSEGPVLMGLTLSKVGITTGWTTGLVTGTCVDAPVDGQFARLCQGRV